MKFLEIQFCMTLFFYTLIGRHLKHDACFIDNIFTNNNNGYPRSDIFMTEFSDHLPVYYMLITYEAQNGNTKTDM